MLKAKKLKKVIALMFIAITLLSTAQPIFAVTDSGSGKWTAGQWDSNIYTTDNKSNLGMLMRRLVNTTTGEKITVFCAEHGVNSQTGTVETGTHNTPTDPKVKRACKVAFFGWYQKYGNYCIDGGIMAADMNSRKMDYVFTQQMVWSTLGQSNATFRNVSIQSQYEAFKADINAKIDNMERKPSFCNETITVEVGQTKTLTDSNNVLGQYASFDKTVDGIRVTHNKGENTLNVTANEDCTKEAIRISENTMFDWGVIKEETHNQHSTVYFTFRDGVQNQLYSLNYNDPVTMSLSFKIDLFGKIELSKLDTEKALVDGAVYTVTGENYNQDVTVTGGKIVVEKLKRGTYTVKEKSAPHGYLLNTETYTVDVKPNQTSKQAIVNTEPTGKIIIYKVSENNDKIGGAVFTVTANTDIYNKAKSKKFYSKGQEVGRITTSAGTGIGQIDNLPMGSYSVKEIQAPKGYLLNEKTYTANLEYKDQHTPVVEIQIEGITNNEPRGSIGITKRDSKTGNVPQGDAKLENAVYKVYANEDIYNVAKSKKFYSKGDLVATRTTNAKGVCEDVTNLPLGKYLVKEETAPIGYLIDKKEYEVNLVYKDQYTKVITGKADSTDKVKEMRVHIFKSGIKVNSGKTPGLAGAEFTIKLNSAVERAYAKGYTYAEVWNGIDEYGNKVEVNSKRVAEAQVIAPTYAAIVTDENGDAYTEKVLPYGTYITKETVTPKDYESSADFTFSITEDESEVIDIAKKVKDIVVNNEQLETYIKLIKKDLKTGKTVTLNSATFQIKATKDIYDRATGKILYKKGEAVTQKIGSTIFNSFTTNAKNLVVPDNSYNNNKETLGTIVTPLKLEVGTYEITEIRTPQGFLQLEKPVAFKVDGVKDYDKDNEGDYIKEVVVKNEKPTGTLIIDKSVAIREDVDTSIVDISDLSKIEFSLTAKEDIIDYSDGSTIYKKGQLVKNYNLDKNGDLRVEELPMGTYELQEIKTLDGLVLNDKKYEIKFEQKDLVTKVYEEKEDISNDTTVFEFSKTDITGEKELVGAKLTVIDENDKVVDSWTSGEKTHKIEGLVVGKEYTLKEETAPNGFVVATEIKFRVENTTEIQKVTMIDKVVTMTKEDIGGKEVEGAELQVIDEDNNVVDEWTSTKEPHRINNLVEGKTYTLIEQYAPDGFVISNEVEFTVTTDKETQEVKMIDKVVEISKQDVSGNELEGATLVVTSTKTKNIVDKWVSGKEPHKINGLIENEEYILHEEIVVDGYVKATDVKFTVTSDKETQKVIMIDKVLEVVKTDLVTGEEIEGAKLKVIDENGNVIDEWTSTKEPHRVVGLEENKKYKLVEITAPYGYEITEEIEFTVSEDKETQRVEMKDMPILQDIKLVKVDSNTKEVIKDKFIFGIYEDAECTKLIKEVKSDKENGTVLFEDLRYGTYYIKEIAAPKGYVLSDKVIKVEMNDKGTFIDNEKVESEDSTYTFEFENVPVDTPKTGDNSNLKLYAGLLGLSILALASVGVHEYKKRKSVNKK